MTTGARCRANTVGDGTAERLAAVWPETSARLRAYLQRRGVSASASEDIAQEVAVRALQSGVSFNDADDLVPWAFTVGWRVFLGDLRKTRGPLPMLDLRDEASPVNVEDEVIGRARMSEVMAAISTLGPRDRGALLALLTDQPLAMAATTGPAPRQAVVRYRARSRLMQALGGLDSVVA